jgi:hypothetical protein
MAPSLVVYLRHAFEGYFRERCRLSLRRARRKIGQLGRFDTLDQAYLLEIAPLVVVV